MREHKYILNDEGEPVPEPDLMKWGAWFEPNRARRIVRQDDVGDILVSTVFLALDHDHSLQGPPILWETMIFGGPHDQYQERYTSKDAALEGHAKALALAQQKEVTS